MKKYTLYNIIRRTLLTLCLMATATMAWALDVTDEASLRTALDGVEQNLTMTQNIALANTLEINRSVTIDMNGYTISANGFRAIHIKIGENVEFKSSKPGAAITAGGGISASNSVIRIGDNTGTERTVGLKIGENVTVQSNICYGVTIFGSATRETLEVDGRISTVNYPAIGGNGNPGMGGTTITIGADAEVSSVHELAIYHPQDGQLTIHGTISGAGGIEMKAGNLTVGADAHISATGTPTHNSSSSGSSTLGYAIALVENGAYPVGLGTINISPAAEIVGPVATLKDNTPTDTHPTFDPSGVQMNVSVTSGGDVKQYASLLDAVNEAPANATIQLLNDIAITETAVIAQDKVTLDLNGKNITATGCRALLVKNAGAQILNTDTSDPVRGTISATGISHPELSVIEVGEASSAANAGLTVGAGVTITTDDCHGITTAGTGSTSSLTVNGTVNTKVRPAIYSTNNFATTIGASANITTTEEVAIYSTGASLSVSGTVSGLSAVETKSGTLTIDGATLTATGTPSHTLNNNGSSTRGYAVAMVKNSTFTAVSTAEFSGTNTITGPVATLIDSGTDADPTFTGITMLADINGEHYSSVIDATNIVPNDGMVKLMENLSLTAPLALNRHATYKLDLDGHNVTATDCGAIAVKSGDVIITNTGAAATISATGSIAATAAVIQVGDNNGENRNISLGIDNNITVSTTVCQGVLLSGTNTRESLTVKGTISTTTQPAIAGNKVNGGTTINIEENANVTSSNNVAIYHPQTGTLTVEGTAGHNAVVSGTTGIEMKAGDLIVGEHATIKATASPASHTASDVAPSTSGYGIAIIENARFAGVGNVDIETTEHISAPVAVAMLVDSEHAGIAEPEFIGSVMLVAEVSGTNTDKYAKLEDAFKVAQTGNTVRLLEDAAINSTINVDKAITVDMNDYTITGKQASGNYVLTTSTDITLKDGGIVAENGGGISSTSGTLTIEKLNVRAKENSLNLAGATATVDANATLTSTNGVTIALGNGATLTVNGKIYNTATNAINATGTTGALTINNGSTISTAAGYAINWQEAGALTINGGQLHGTTAAVRASKGSVTIEGGTFTGTTDALVIENANASDCTPSVKHGTFNSGTGDPIKSNGGTNAATGFVEGDYFSKAIAQTLCATGFMISPTTNSNGMYYLVSELVITDATIWTVPATAYTIHTAKYIRNTGMGITKFGTLCLPFSFEADGVSGMKFYSVHEIRGDKLYLNLISSGTISAGTPVIFERTGINLETSFTIESADATIPASETINANGLVGTFVTTDITDNLTTKYFLNDDHFHKATEKITVPAFRAYINNPSVSSARVLTICMEDEPLDIDALFEDESDENEIFDLQGNRQESLKPGFNLVKKNGRTIKVYVNK